MTTQNNNNNELYGIEKFEGSFEQEELGVTIVVNKSINDINNAEALGIYVYLLARPPGWKLNAKQLAAHFDCNKDKIYKTLNYLMEKGYITRQQNRNNGKIGNAHYKVHLHPVSPRLEKPDTVIPDTYKTKILVNKEIKNNNPKSLFETSTEKDSPVHKTNFENFWAIYPVKKAKEICKQYWHRHKLDKIAEEVIAMLRKQIAEDDHFLKGFIRNPSKYLREEGWLDPITVARERRSNDRDFAYLQLGINL